MYSLNIDPNNPAGNPDPAELRDLGVEMVRYTFYDGSGGEQVDSARIDFYRQKAKGYRDAGIGSLIILTYDTYPGKPPFADNWDNYIARFAQRAGQIAQQLAPYKPAYQIWNEPDHDRKNIGTSYDPCLREEVFGQMLRRTRDAIKAADPKAVIVTGGLASGNPAWLTAVIKAVGGDLPADVVAFHPYAQRPERDWPRPDWAAGYIGDLVDGYYKAGRKKTLWISEMGSKPNEVGGDEGSAEFLRRYYRAIITRFGDKVEELFWFCYSDGMVSPFGLKDGNGNPKPAYNAFRQAVAARAQWTPAPAIAAAPPPPSVQPVTPPPPPVQPVAPPPPLPVVAPPPPPLSQPPPPVPAAQEEDLTQLLAQTMGLQNLVQQLQAQLAQLQEQVQQLFGQQSQLQAQVQQLSSQMVSLPTASSPVSSPPPIQNITDQLKRDPSKQFPTRSLDQIQMLVIHHTAVAPTVGADRIAAHRVDKQGWPGIGYHYFITADGQIQQTNELTTIASHAGEYNPIAIGICFAGDFTQTSPTPAQIEAGAQLIAWLLRERNLSLSAVFGYKELVNTQSPGAQWDSGARWGDQLRDRIQAQM
jgi:hypothetical protein